MDSVADLTELELNLLKCGVLLGGERILEFPPYYIITVILAGAYRRIDLMMTEEDQEIFKKYQQKWRVTCKELPKILTQFSIS